MTSNFIVSAVVDRHPGARSFVELHNPRGSGVATRFPKWNLAWSAVSSETSLTRSGYDFRCTSNQWGAAYKFGKNKIIGDDDSKTILTIGNCQAGNLPANDTIVYEPWPNSIDGGIPKFFDRPPYELAADAPFIIRPGRGIMIASAHDQTYLISTLEFSEEPFEEEFPSIETPLTIGAIDSDLASASNLFDSDESTYGVKEGTSFYAGVVLDSQVPFTGLEIKSPVGRSFSGANPGRKIMWSVQSSDDGVIWRNESAGLYTEPGTGAVQGALAIPLAHTSKRCRITLSTSSPAGWRAASLRFTRGN